jgi:hypothetical protein
MWEREFVKISYLNFGRMQINDLINTPEVKITYEGD